MYPFADAPAVAFAANFACALSKIAELGGVVGGIANLGGGDDIPKPGIAFPVSPGVGAPGVGIVFAGGARNDIGGPWPGISGFPGMMALNTLARLPGESGAPNLGPEDEIPCG